MIFSVMTLVAMSRIFFPVSMLQRTDTVSHSTAQQQEYSRLSQHPDPPHYSRS
jgi:hypothetical protein